MPGDDLPSEATAINVSAGQLQPGFAELVLGTLAEAGVAPDRLVIELTEEASVSTPERIAVLESVHRLGARIDVRIVSQLTGDAIADFDPADSPDIVLALHACDTATDDALAQGIGPHGDASVDQRAAAETASLQHVNLGAEPHIE